MVGVGVGRFLKMSLLQVIRTLPGPRAVGVDVGGSNMMHVLLVARILPGARSPYVAFTIGGSYLVVVVGGVVYVPFVAVRGTWYNSRYE